MKTKLTLMLMLFLFMKMQSQVSTPFNVMSFTTDYVGWNSAQTLTLNIDHQATGANAQPIIFHTDIYERVRIQHFPSGYTLVPNNSATNLFPNNEMTRVTIPYNGTNTSTLFVLGSPGAANPARSLLHIGGYPGNAIRHWMNIGLITSGASDMAYFGLRQKDKNDVTGRTSLQFQEAGTSADNNDAVVAWGDNEGGAPGTGATDNLTFIFADSETQSGPSSYKYSTEGREIARMTGAGNFGIGPVFFDNAQPQNLLHINSDAANSAYLQISNQTITGQSAADGFQIGIVGAGDADINQKENADLRFFTNNTQQTVIKNTGNFGIGTNSPNNKLEITTSSTIHPYFGSANGSSGLRFTNLTSTNTPVANGVNGVTNQKLLTADQNGDVVFADGSSFGIGNFCIAGSQNSLTGDYEIPLSVNTNTVGYDYYFSGDKPHLGHVNIGLPCGSTSTSIGAKLNVNTSVATHQNSLTLWGVGILANNTSTSEVNIGVQGLVQNALSYNIAIEGSSNGGGPKSFGGLFYSKNGTLTNIGVAGWADNGSGWQTVSVPAGGANIGVYGWSGKTIGVDFAGLFDGDVFINGPTCGTNFALTSDQQFKTNVDTIPNALGIIKKLRPKTFFFDTNNVYKMKFDNKRQYGIIAQQVFTVVPELVSTHIKPAYVDSLGIVVTPSVSYKAVNYDAFIGIMIRAIQQLSEQNQKRDSLMKILIDCCNRNGGGEGGRKGNSGGNGSLFQTDVELSDKNYIVLNQNVPNPFAESCVITYNIPMDFKFAQIVFNNTDGKIIKTVDITQKGRGQLNVFANDLSNGMYSYYLIVDGKLIDTKKLVKQE